MSCCTWLQKSPVKSNEHIKEEASDFARLPALSGSGGIWCCARLLGSGSTSSPPRASTLLCRFAQARNIGDRRSEQEEENGDREKEAHGAGLSSLPHRSALRRKPRPEEQQVEAQGLLHTVGHDLKSTRRTEDREQRQTMNRNRSGQRIDKIRPKTP